MSGTVEIGQHGLLFLIYFLNMVWVVFELTPALGTLFPWFDQAEIASICFIFWLCALSIQFSGNHAHQSTYRSFQIWLSQSGISSFQAHCIMFLWKVNILPGMLPLRGKSQGEKNRELACETEVCLWFIDPKDSAETSSRIEWLWSLNSSLPVFF